ncbi:hypothetical protein M9Y10_013689 [Tritrichomonas musculus]|uniref:Glycosyltransferase 61 catalytic domain-containing protein n=1 Tax=Tritrichomonas musculus TaxID=1915356 RepID=A0ABR2KXH0_9EUKA
MNLILLNEISCGVTAIIWDFESRDGGSTLPKRIFLPFLYHSYIFRGYLARGFLIKHWRNTYKSRSRMPFPRKFIKDKQNLIFIIYFLFSFCLVDYILLLFFPYPEPTENDINKNEEKYITINSLPSVCDSIEEVSTKNDIIIVKYKRLLPTKNQTYLLSHFALRTNWLSQVIFFPLGTAKLEKRSSNTISFSFYLPVVDNYSAILICAAPDKNVSTDYNELEPYIISKTDIRLTATEFDIHDINYFDYSRFRCHHKEVFETRWCEFRNIAFFDHHFFFFSPAVFEFPEPFIVPGPRAPPFDKDTDRFIIEPIVLNLSPSELNKKFEEDNDFDDDPRHLSSITDFCYVYGVFHNYYMLWHTIFDFMIPLYNFINHVLKGSDTKENRRIYVRSDGVWAFHSFMKIFSIYPVTIIEDQNPTILMHAGTIGIEKLERDPNPKRTYDDSIAFQYNFNRSTAIGMREAILNELVIPANEVGYGKQPYVILIDRGKGSRNIGNIDELFELMKSTCSFCHVEKVQLHLINVDQQIEMASRASVIAGLHGSGLSHVIWMQESRKSHSTHLIEILPYNYSCRNWYNVAADVAGAQYHAVMNKEVPETHNSQLKYCWKNPQRCPTLNCHDLLRDQPTTVELDTFNETWLPIVDELRSTVIKI